MVKTALSQVCLDEDDETWKRVLSEMDSLGPRNSGVGIRDLEILGTGSWTLGGRNIGGPRLE